MEELSYDQLIDDLIELRKEEIDRIWDQGAICLLLRERMQVKAKDIASQIGVSSGYVGDLARTYAAFPDDSSRNKEMPFSIHKLCAKSNDPEYWLRVAEENQYSTRQLQEAMQGKQNDPLKAANKAWDKVIKIIEEGGEVGAWMENQIHDYALSL